MKTRHLLLLIIFAILNISGWGPFLFLSNSTSSVDNDAVGSKTWIEKKTRIITSQADNIDPSVLKIGLTAYAKARSEGLDNKQLLTIVDYSKPSTERRLWVLDLKNEKVLFNTLVAHGKNSGGTSPTSFSNDPSSLQSSVGVFKTVDPYVGHDGYSLRIQGLERGINDNAYRRNIVFHGAWYVSPEVAKQRNTIGRSWGCMAVGEDVIKPLINTIKNDTLVVAYYPDHHWLNSSSFLNSYA